MVVPITEGVVRLVLGRPDLLLLAWLGSPDCFDSKGIILTSNEFVFGRECLHLMHVRLIRIGFPPQSIFFLDKRKPNERNALRNDTRIGT